MNDHRLPVPRQWCGRDRTRLTGRLTLTYLSAQVLARHSRAARAGSKARVGTHTRIETWIAYHRERIFADLELSSEPLAG